MNRPLVIIESPYAGDLARNQAYLRAALRDALERHETPFASHAIYPKVLDDYNPDERQLGIELGYQFWSQAERIVFYTDLGWSSGMEAARRRAKKLHFAIDYRMLGTGWED